VKKQLIVAFVLAAGLLAGAQWLRAEGNKRPLTLSEYTVGSPQYVSAQSVWGLQWKGQDLISYKSTGLQHKTLKDKTWKDLLSLDELKALYQAKGLDESFRSFPYSYVALSDGRLLITEAKRVVLLNEKLKQIESVLELPAGVQAQQVAPDYQHIAYVQKDNLYVAGQSGKPVQISFDGSAEIVYGQSVHQNEFGIHKGIFWSPDGKKVAFYRMDQSMVKPYPILHVDADRPYGENQYYPMAGTPIHHVTLGIYDLETGKTTYLKTPDAAKTYLTNIAWTPNSQEILIAELNREQTHMELKAYSPQTGEKMRLLFSEHNDIYTEPQHPALFLPNKSGDFIWRSRRDGYEHLYLYSYEGKLKKQLTSGAWEVTDVQGFSPDGKDLYYISTEVSPLDRQVYRLNLAKNQRTRLTSESGWHNPRISPDGKAFIDSYESQNVARAIKVKDLNGKVLTSLLDEENPDANYLTPKIELGTIKAADGITDLHYRLIKPYNFNPNKKYPTIVYVYNGPHAQLVQNRFRAGESGWGLNMANQGYIVFTVDGRGSAYRGAAFEQVIHRQLGKHEMADQMKGVDFLRSLLYVDVNRLGVFGWSFGGFMTTNLMLTHSDVFKVGVAGGPVMDWSRYEIMYGERYMDTPQENPEGYKSNNLLLRAGNLKGRLLLIHGTIDPVVIWQHSLLFLKEAVKAGTHPDYLVYPEHQHNVLGPDRVHLNEAVTRYFKDHL